MSNSIKYTARYDDHTTRIFTIPNVPSNELNPSTIESKMNAYNDAWGWQLPTLAPVADITGYEEYIAAMPQVFISTGGASLVSLESATIVIEEEQVIYSG